MAKGELMIKEKIEALILESVQKIIHGQTVGWSAEAKEEDMRLELWSLIRRVINVLIERLKESG